MIEETFLIKSPAGVAIWCSGSESRFDVLNGGWRGRLKDGKIHVLGEGKKALCAGEVVWRGIVPRQYQTDFNSAIAWIRREIDSENRSRQAEARLAEQRP